ncbi:FAD-dependent oxidoreductase [Nonomuraea sediminis]|uniref:FAD-dependent oxidoreductase n=1 Tax=Nonomuraea sediminis TaxID=2835864 RepID=UPI001BDD701C|nr:FAD-dependent oxidoreductase [Nonomuraea sediminis]
MDFDVVVAGGGPVGLLLACELRLGGASVVVLERAASPYTELKAGAMGARALNAPSADALRRRGLLPAVRQAALTWFEPDPELIELIGSGVVELEEMPFIGHFAGIPIRADRLDPDDPDLARDSDGGGVISQLDLERILAARAEELGAEVRRGVEVTGLAQDPQGVTVRTREGSPERGRWLVGCDGGRSAVRKAGGFDFAGTDGEFVGLQALVEWADPEALPMGDWVRTEAGSYVHGPMPGRLHVVEYGRRVDRDAPVTAQEVREALKRVSGLDLEVTTVRTGSRYSDATRQATTYRDRRVLLAGDAAHIHSPAGGQGLNLGLGDAMNLGWKLAAVARGEAPEALLDTYTAERHPIGAWVQSWSDAQTALSRPDSRTRALRAVVGDFLDAPQAATYVLKHIAGLAQRYALPGTHPLVGRPAPGTPEHTGALLVTDRADLATAAKPWGDRITVVPGSPTAFVRPDGYVAWATDQPAHPDEAAAAITTWLGPA